MFKSTIAWLPAWRNLLPLLLGATAAAYLLLVVNLAVPRPFGAPLRLSPDLLNALTWPLVLGTTLLAWWRHRDARWVAGPLYFALPLVGVQAGLSVLMRTLRPSAPWGALSLGVVLVAQGLVITAGVVALGRLRAPGRMAGLNYRPGFARQTLLALGAVFVTMVSGAAITVSGAQGVCQSWPFCGDAGVLQEPLAWVQLFHRLVVGLAAVVVARLLWRAWVARRSQTGILALTTAGGVLFMAQGWIGALQVLHGDPSFLSGLHAFSSAALWAVLVGLVVTAGMTAGVPAADGAVTPSPTWRGRVRDYLALTKPIVVLLLLVTTYGGMVVGGRAWPSLRLTLWTLLGGALAAGGASAINQYIDRQRDRLMRRTARRPIPAGRLTPAEGLAFGVALCLGAFYLLAVQVNLLAAALAVAGMVYYVLLYSIVLKDASVQNIVIGGGAGAIPPLVGWAAVTGDLPLAALTLFAVIFMWTPPHFWALALVRRKDYARAGVPMLPVVRGERETRRQIFVYTLALVAITLTLPLFGVGGWLYLVSAVLLGMFLIRSAWVVLRRDGNKVAWKLYRHSSMYLAFLFLALMIDAVVIV